jgi:hypothetical protein
VFAFVSDIFWLCHQPLGILRTVRGQWFDVTAGTDSRQQHMARIPLLWNVSAVQAASLLYVTRKTSGHEAKVLQVVGIGCIGCLQVLSTLSVLPINPPRVSTDFDPR